MSTNYYINELQIEKRRIDKIKQKKKYRIKKKKCFVKKTRPFSAPLTKIFMHCGKHGFISGNEITLSKRCAYCERLIKQDSYYCSRCGGYCYTSLNGITNDERCVKCGAKLTKNIYGDN